jgi:hypothetical protein
LRRVNPTTEGRILKNFDKTYQRAGRLQAYSINDLKAREYERRPDLIEATDQKACRESIHKGGQPDDLGLRRA